jgi:hypothetical protein
VRGRARAGQTDEYGFTSAADQFVTIVVVPESALMFMPQAMSVLFAASVIDYDTPAVAPLWPQLTDDFDIELAAGGEVVARSSAAEQVDWIQARVPAGAELSARITAVSNWSTESGFPSPLSGDYRLFVVGSTEHIQSASVSGAHQSTGP